MKIDKNQLSFYILCVGFLGTGSYYLYSFHSQFVNSNALVSFVTFFVGGIAIFLYLKGRKDQKKDAAKIILQEIRRAEDIISDYKKFRSFKFTRKIIVTNSWAKNIHYFTDYLTPDEIDKVSDLYSAGEYLDKIILMVSDIKFDERVKQQIVEQARKQVEEQIKGFALKMTNRADNLQPQSQSTASGLPQGSENNFEPMITPQEKTPLNFNVNVNLSYDSTSTDILFQAVVLEYEPIYYSKIIRKIEELAE